MRHFIPVAVVALAALTPWAETARAAPGAPTSAVSDGRPILLAQNTTDGQNMLSLLQDIQRLEAQVRDLRGQLDTLKYQLRQNEQGQRDLYENLDKRLSALESGSGSSASAGSSDSYNDRYGQDNSEAATGSADPQIQSEYMSVFKKLKNGQYDAAASGFRGFLDQHPESRYSDNAWYWLGEANYVQRNYDTALAAFQTVANRFKGSDKVAASLYKIGVIQAEQGQTDNAQGTLQRVIDQYPDDNAAQLARKRLDGLGG